MICKTHNPILSFQCFQIVVIHACTHCVVINIQAPNSKNIVRLSFTTLNPIEILNFKGEKHNVIFTLNFGCIYNIHRFSQDKEGSFNKIGPTKCVRIALLARLEFIKVLKDKLSIYATNCIYVSISLQHRCLYSTQTKPEANYHSVTVFNFHCFNI